MELTILGASGGVGTCLTHQALAAGHAVTAVVRDPARLVAGPHPKLTVVTADIMDPVSVLPAVTGADAILTAAGPRGTGPTTVIRDSVRAIVAAMDKAGVRRLLMVSGTIVSDDGDGIWLRSLLKPVARRTFLRNVCADMRAGEAEAMASGLDWTIVRPPRLTGKPATGHYRIASGANPPHATTISRADLAACMLDLIGDRSAVTAAIGVAN